MCTLLKKMTVFATAVCLTLSAGAQTKDFEKFANIKGVEYVHLDENMVKLAAQNGEPIKHGGHIIIGDKCGDILSQVDDVKVFTCKQGKAAKKLKTGVLALLKNEKYQSLIDVNESDALVKIYQSHAGEKTQNVVFVEDTEDQETVLVVIDGTLDIAKLIEQQAEKD